MPTVTSENKAAFDRAQMSKNKKPEHSPGELADKAWALSAKKFPSSEAMRAHQDAAKSYREMGHHDFAERHQEAAFAHIKGMMKN